MESFKITNVFPETRRLGLKSVEMMISFLFKLVLLFTILTIFNSSLSFVQQSVEPGQGKSLISTDVSSLDSFVAGFSL